MNYVSFFKWKILPSLALMMIIKQAPGIKSVPISLNQSDNIDIYTQYYVYTNDLLYMYVHYFWPVC